MERDVIPILRTGTGKKLHGEHGLEKLRDNDASEIGHMFDDASQPHFFIMALRQRVSTADNKFDNSDTAGGDILGDERFIGEIVAELRRIFGDDAPLSMVPYSPERRPVIPGDYRDDQWEIIGEGTCSIPTCKWNFPTAGAVACLVRRQT